MTVALRPSSNRCNELNHAAVGNHSGFAALRLCALAACL